MGLNNLLNIKLKKDLKEDLLSEYKKNNYLNSLSLKNYEEIINKKIDCIESIDFSDKKFKKDMNNDLCCARVWNYHKGTQCNYKKNNGDYCNHHKKLLEKKRLFTI